MGHKSWPSIPRKKRMTRGWSSSPALKLIAYVKLWTLKKIKARPKHYRPSISPLPGPSGLHLVNNKGITTSCVQQGSPSPDRRVQNNKRKSEDKIEDSPQKKAKSDDRPRKAKFKTKRHSHKSEQCDSASHAASEEIDRPVEEDGKNLSKDSTPSYVSGETEPFYTATDSEICANKRPLKDKRGHWYQRHREDRTTTNSHKDELHQKYTWFDMIQEGGFGRVFAGIRREDKKPVVLKCVLKTYVKYMDVEIDGNMCSVPDEVFYLIKVGAGPNASDCTVCPQLLDWYDLGQEIGLVMERPEPCLDLNEYNRRQRQNGISMKTAKTVFRQLVDSAIEIESRGIFHRDIKPENVLVETETDTPKAWIIDFGCATLFQPGQPFRVPQGTPEYASPEWFRQKMYTAKPTTVWQLGLTLYCMLFRRRPQAKPKTIASMRPVPIPRTIPPDCKDLLLGCLNKNPDDRLTLQDMRNHPWLTS